jgi:hypothetical protein
MAAVTDFNRSGHQPFLEGRQGLDNRPELIQALYQALVRRPRLRNLLPGQGAEPDFWAFGPQPRRLLLLGSQYFQELCLCFGLAFFSPELAKIVSGPLVRHWRSELGRDLFDWALGRGKFLLGALRDDLYSWLEDTPQEPTFPTGRQDFIEMGLIAVNIAWSPLPPALKARAGGYNIELEQPILESLSQRTFAALKKILLSEVAPLWQPCFS